MRPGIIHGSPLEPRPMGDNTGGLRVFSVPSSGLRVIMCHLPGFLLAPRRKSHCCSGLHKRTPRLREAGPLFHRGEPETRVTSSPAQVTCWHGPHGTVASGLTVMQPCPHSGSGRSTTGGDRKLWAGALRGFGQHVFRKRTPWPPTFRRSSQKPWRPGEWPHEAAAFGTICEVGTDSFYPESWTPE